MRSPGNRVINRYKLLCVLQVEARSSRRTPSALNCQVISPGPTQVLLYECWVSNSGPHSYAANILTHWATYPVLRFCIANKFCNLLVLGPETHALISQGMLHWWPISHNTWVCCEDIMKRPLNSHIFILWTLPYFHSGIVSISAYTIQHTALTLRVENWRPTGKDCTSATWSHLSGEQYLRAQKNYFLFQ